MLSICFFVIIVRELIEKKFDLFLFVSLEEFSCIRKNCTDADYEVLLDNEVGFSVVKLPEESLTPETIFMEKEYKIFESDGFFNNPL